MLIGGLTRRVLNERRAEGQAVVQRDEDRVGRRDRGPEHETEETGASLGWVTNHFEGDYTGSDNELHHYEYFCKIAYVGPAPSAGPDPFAGSRIWGVYAILEENQNDQFGELGGRLHFVNRITGPGLGQF